MADEFPSGDWLCVPVEDLGRLVSGLLLVDGRPGSGKSSAAALLGT